MVRELEAPLPAGPYLGLSLFGACPGCLREGVQTKCTADDAARWHAHPIPETAAARQPLPSQLLVVLQEAAPDEALLTQRLLARNKLAMSLLRER